MKHTFIIVLLLVGLFTTLNYVGYAQECGQEHNLDCDDCCENGQPVQWSEPKFKIGIPGFASDWDIIYKTRVCKGELHFKIISFKTYNSNTNNQFSRFPMLLAASNWLLDHNSILANLIDYNIPRIPKNKIKVRLYLSSCWVKNSAQDTYCYENGPWQIIVPCSKACCQLEADVTPICIDKLNIWILPSYPTDVIECSNIRDPDVCYPPGPFPPGYPIGGCETNLCIHYGI